jgi:hypothetical protein
MFSNFFEGGRTRVKSAVRATQVAAETLQPKKNQSSLKKIT